jgi:hypothetical protein
MKDEKGVSYLFDEFLNTQLSDRFTFKFNKLVEYQMYMKNFKQPLDNIFNSLAMMGDFLESNVGIKSNIQRPVLSFNCRSLFLIILAMGSLI